MKNIYIKLAIGLVLFATWIALVVFKVPDAGDIINCIKLALAGLGVYHLSTPTAPAANDRQGGAALPGLLALMGLTGALLMTGCATSQPQTTQATFTQGCAAYSAAFSVALELRRAGKLTHAQIDQITLLDSQITPLCTGPLPTDATAAAQQVTAAVTTLAIIEAIKETK